MAIINGKAADDSRFALTGKDGAFYSDGVMLASVESFTANVNVTNAKYNVLGDPQEHETFASYAVTLTMAQVVVEDDKFITDFMKKMEEGKMPSWNFQGVLKGSNGSEQRVVYKQCIPSGQVDLQNVTPGDVIKRNWNFFVNCPPKLQTMLKM